MNQQPDKLFRDKLQSFQTPAPSGAWNRIEANLDKKNHKALWFRIAASLLLVAVAAYLLWPSNRIEGSQPELAEKKKTQEQISPEKKKEEKVVTPVPLTENKIAKAPVQPSKRATDKKNTIVNESTNRQVDLSENNVAVLEQSSQEEHPEVLQAQIDIVAPGETETTTVASAETQKVKIIFSAEQVDNKYLDKKALAEATSDDKKPSTLKKLLDKAYDLKYNQDPFGDLRQRKDEILALNFRKDKRSDN